MERIGSHAVANELRIDPGTATFRHFQFFEDHNAGAFADNKSIAVAFKRPGSVLGIAVARRKRSHRGKARYTHRRDCRFSAAADHNVSVATLDDLKTVANSVSARGTRRRRRRIRALQSIAN